MLAWAHRGSRRPTTSGSSDGEGSVLFQLEFGIEKFRESLGLDLHRDVYPACQSDERAYLHGKPPPVSPIRPDPVNPPVDQQHRGNPALRSKDVRAMPAGKKVLHVRGRAQHILIKCREKSHRSGWLRRLKFVKIRGQNPGFRSCKADFANRRSQRSQHRIHMRERCPAPSRIVYPCRRTIRRKEPAGQVDPSRAGVRSERSTQPHVRVARSARLRRYWARNRAAHETPPVSASNPNPVAECPQAQRLLRFA